MVNYRRNGVQINSDGDSVAQRLNDQLTRRFFVVDAFSGASTAGVIPQLGLRVRVLVRVRVRVRVRSRRRRAKKAGAIPQLRTRPCEP